MKIAIINGPNLNLVGTREPDIYGRDSLNDYMVWLKQKYAAIDLTYFQSNIEGEIIDEIQKRGEHVDAIIINAGAYTHTSIAIADALKAVKTKSIIEVHISNVYAREHYRRSSYIAPVCMGSICGFGLKSYELAILSLLN
ncbi:MAG: type II 3-dehydroquinate dehydratase [Chitinophagaceae bacterium]|nr:type II 3-dehydroquinate dehydratase [Chitinophagaceae bacterium]